MQENNLYIFTKISSFYPKVNHFDILETIILARIPCKDNQDTLV